MRVLTVATTLGLAVIAGGFAIRPATPETTGTSLPEFAAIDPPSGIQEAYVVRPPMTVAADGTRTIRLNSDDEREERLLVIAPQRRPTRLAAIFGFRG